MAAIYIQELINALWQHNRAADFNTF